MEISVCMIVKNEEDCLARVLDCVKQCADEIVIVDTGSTDKTIEIAKQYTNKVFSYVWQNNFAEARNFSFSKATKDYIFWIDADDYITKNNIDKINRLKSINNVDVFMMKYAIAFDESNNPTFTFYRERMVRNNNRYVWQGFIHEVIVPSGVVNYTDIVIEHRKNKISNPKRNLNIYRYYLRQNKQFNAREQYYYSKELFYNKYYKKCLKELNKYLNMESKFTPNIYDAILTKSKIYNILKQYKLAIKTIMKFNVEYNLNAELCCELGDSFVKLNKYNNAIFYYKSALNCDKNINSGGFVFDEYYDLIPCLQLVYLYYLLGDKDKAKYYHNLIKNKYPNNQKIIYNNQFFNA